MHDNRLTAHKKEVMDRVKGWFWKDSSKAQDQQSKNQEPSSTVVLPDTDKNKENTEHLKQVNRNSNQSNSAEVTKVNNVEPVLYSDVPVKTRVLLWLQKNTYLQPEDCLFCKLTASTFATFLLVSGLNAYKVSAIKRNINKGRIRASYTIIFAMWATFMYKEWYNAVFQPPGDQPRSFIESEKVRLTQFKELLEKRKKENDQDSGK